MRRWVAPSILAMLVVVGFLFVRGDIPCDVLRAQPVCEVALQPGPAEDTLTKVEVADADTYPSEGELLLTTVAVKDELSLSSWLAARRSPVVDVVARETIYPPGADRSEVAELNQALMADSQLVATIAALRSLGYEFEGEGALVSAVTEDAVTDDLEPGDVIVGIDGQPVFENRDVVELVRASEPGDRMVLEVMGADGDFRDVPITLGSSPEHVGVAYIGVLLTTELDLPVDVTIDAGVIGGPSAGLMFALSIIELLEPGDITGGQVIAGTGTVDADGVVGAVGGVRQKVSGASSSEEDDRPATIFLVPRGNLDDARSAVVSSELLVVPVDTLDDALHALEDLREGRQPSGALALAADG